MIKFAHGKIWFHMIIFCPSRYQGLSFVANVFMWGKCYHVKLMLACGMKCYHMKADVHNMAHFMLKPFFKVII
jgi:hypothetical protein